MTTELVRNHEIMAGVEVAILRSRRISAYRQKLLGCTLISGSYFQASRTKKHHQASSPQSPPGTSAPYNFPSKATCQPKEYKTYSAYLSRCMRTLRRCSVTAFSQTFGNRLAARGIRGNRREWVSKRVVQLVRAPVSSRPRVRVPSLPPSLIG